jgi:hypothetical protein
MNCRFCGKEPVVVAVVPYDPGDDPDLSPYACISCATEHNLYCPIHNASFVGSSDGRPFCTRCVEEEVREHGDEAEDIYARIKEMLDDDSLYALKEAAQLSAWVTEETEAVAVLRFVVTLAHRKRISFDQALVLATSERAISELLPIVI